MRATSMGLLQMKHEAVVSSRSKFVRLVGRKIRRLAACIFLRFRQKVQFRCCPKQLMHLLVDVCLISHVVKALHRTLP